MMQKNEKLQLSQQAGVKQKSITLLNITHLSSVLSQTNLYICNY